MIWNGAPSSVKIGKKVYNLMPGKDVQAEVENFWKTTESKKHGNLKDTLVKNKAVSSEASTNNASVKNVSGEKEKDKASA